MHQQRTAETDEKLTVDVFLTPSETKLIFKGLHAIAEDLEKVAAMHGVDGGATYDGPGYDPSDFLRMVASRVEVAAEHAGVAVERPS